MPNWKLAPLAYLPSRKLACSIVGTDTILSGDHKKNTQFALSVQVHDKLAVGN
jgi:hypothetical protein